MPMTETVDHNTLTPEPSHSDTITDILRRISVEGDNERLRSGAALVNVFNFAIQNHAGRTAWTADDYRAFAIAAASLDKIGRDATQFKQSSAAQDTMVAQQVRDSFGKRNGGALRPVTNEPASETRMDPVNFT